MAAKDEYIPFMGHLWLQIEDGSVTVGISEEGLEELTEISDVKLPAENETVSGDDIIGEIETDEGPLNLYAPVDGKVVEINGTVLDNPELIIEDPLGDGWLYRIEASNPDDLEALASGVSDDDEEE